MKARTALAVMLVFLAASVRLPATAVAAFGFQSGGAGFAVAALKANESPATQAGSHPATFKTAINLEAGSGDETLRSLRVNLPPGFLLNPTVTSECTQAAFEKARVSPYEASASGESCPNSSQVGVIEVDTGTETRYFGLFTLAPPFGSAVAFGAAPLGSRLVFTGDFRESDAGFDLRLLEAPKGLHPDRLEVTIWGTPWDGVHDGLRGNCLNENSGGSNGACLVFGSAPAPQVQTKSIVTLPTTPCGTPFVFTATAISWQGQEAQASASIPPLGLCNAPLSIPTVKLMTDAAAARTGLTFNLDVNDGGGILNPNGIARPAIKTAVVSLPEGLTINPSLGAGLGVCDEAEFARESAFSEQGAGCPNSSKFGNVTVEGAIGLEEPLKGGLYLARPFANRLGTMLAVYMVARLPRRGLIAKSVGKLVPDPQSGRLVATFDELPRVLYTHFALTLREGQRSTLVSPPLCGLYSAGMETASWAEPALFRPDSSVFAINRSPEGGCPTGTLPFAPGLIAGSINPAAGAYTPFYLRMTRNDSEQEITRYSATFPPGMLGKLAGVGVCSDAALARAAGRTGSEEQADPSCPAASKIGHTIAGFGVGGTLAWAPGDLFLAGPYHGAPLSVAAVDSVLIGPFDLGTVVVRQAIRVDPRSAQVRLDATGSDPIPHILFGIPLHLRDIRVYVDRPGFTLNPTSCDPMKTSSHLAGAGNDPFTPADDGAADSTQRYQVINCQALGFRPQLSLRLRGAVRHGGYPSLRAVYKPRPGDANLSAISVGMPPSVFLAQEHIDQVCTRVQFDAENCPPGSIYGHARAVTPLLSQPLEGPVYLRSSRNSVPDLVADLRGGGFEIEVPGRIDSNHGGMRANYESLPDAPVTSFTLTLFGGKRGLLSNAESPCIGVHAANARYIAQSNETAIVHPHVRAKCGGKSKKRHRTQSKGMKQG